MVVYLFTSFAATSIEIKMGSTEHWPRGPRDASVATIQQYRPTRRASQLRSGFSPPVST